MPTYVYKFIDTDETIEVQQAFSDATLTEAVHPTSGKVMQVKKVFLPVGVTFKGGGFFKTDNRGSATTSAKADSKAEGKAEGKAESSSASKSETTSNAAPGAGSKSESKPAGSTTAPAPASS